jgi:hypothetical protein
MGTKADFYKGQGQEATWIGAVEQDGYPDAIPAEILIQVNEIMFEELVVEFLQKRRPRSFIASEGDQWPWIWPDSQMTDYTYMFFNNKVHMGHFGKIVDPVMIVQGCDMITAEISPRPLKLPKFTSKIIQTVKELNLDGSKTT